MNVRRIKDLSDAEKWKRLARYDVNQAASEFAAEPPEKAAAMADALGIAYLVNIVGLLGTDAAVDLLRNLPEATRESILKEIPGEKAAALHELLGYEPGTAGAAMAKEYLSIPVDSTIGQATAYLQALPREKKGKVSYIYAVDKERRLEGVIQVRDLVFYPPDKSVRDIIKSPVVQVETGMKQMDVARLLERHRYLGLPVVDAGQRLVGVISADNVIGVLQDEASDDIAKSVGIGAEEIRTRSIRKIMRFRLPWLLVNILSGLLCAYIVGAFEAGAANLAVLFLFIPVVLGISESTGVQGATILVRNLALGNVALKDLLPLYLREVVVGVLIGLICGGIVGAFAFSWQGNQQLGWALAGSMSLSIFISAIVGLSLPLIFKSFKIDPAMASGPLVLALCDLQTLLVYFNISRVMLA